MPREREGDGDVYCAITVGVVCGAVSPASATRNFTIHDSLSTPAPTLKEDFFSIASTVLSWQ